MSPKHGKIRIKRNLTHHQITKVSYASFEIYADESESYVQSFETLEEVKQWLKQRGIPIDGRKALIQELKDAPNNLESVDYQID